MFIALKRLVFVLLLPRVKALSDTAVTATLQFIGPIANLKYSIRISALQRVALTCSCYCTVPDFLIKVFIKIHCTPRTTLDR